MDKVVLAYSGGLDTSVAVAWLKEQYGAEVITLTVDVGGGSLREGVDKLPLAADGTTRDEPPDRSLAQPLELLTGGHRDRHVRLPRRVPSEPR